MMREIKTLLDTVSYSNKMRIAWVPNRTSIENGSYRLQCLYNSQYLNLNGVQSDIHNYDDRPSGSWKGKYDLVVWIRTDQPKDAFLHEIPVIFFVCDGPMPAEEYLQKAVAIVTDSPWVKERRLPFSVRHKTYVIPGTSSGDIPLNLQNHLSLPPEEKSCKLVWIGTEQNYFWAEDTIKHLRNFWEIEIISAGDFITKKWSLETVASDIQNCHIGIVPFPYNLNFGDTKGFLPLAKDIDRVTLLQACGLPVVASPLPNYLIHIEHNRDGFISDGPIEFENTIRTLLNNPQLFLDVAKTGREKALKVSSVESTGEKWKTVLMETRLEKTTLN